MTSAVTNPWPFQNEIIREVMKDCCCTQDRAIQLLQRSNNDPEKAKNFHRKLMGYIRPIAVPSDDTDSNPAAGEELELPDESYRESSSRSINEPDIRQNLPTEEDKGDWDFILPSIPPPSNVIPGDAFSLHDIVGAMQHDASLQNIQNYLGYYDEKTVRRNINGTVDGFPAIFFVVATNDPELLRTWVAYGGDVAAIHEGSKVPLLAFAIIHSDISKMDTTLLVATLLSLGASPRVIPRAFYTPYSQDLPEDGPDDKNLTDINDDENKRWCTNAARAKLAKTTNLTQRYYLDRADKMKVLSRRYMQVAKRQKAEPLLGLPYFLIGQAMAADLLKQKLLSYLVLSHTGKSKPLVLVFAGPSGHGKTELARRLGYLLSLELEVVDCTIFNEEMELFGPRKPYIGAANGSPLNNFLARNTGQRCIVFLDEFEKTTPDIHNALLLPFNNGEYQDRRHLTEVDCSRTIWILATNALDNTIKNFCSKHHETTFLNDDQNVHAPLMNKLSQEMKADFISQFGPPITGRVSAFLPFLPFSPGEQAVVVHKYLLELSHKVRNPINLSVGPDERLLGNVQLHVRKDYSVCHTLAEAAYSPDLGARSLIAAVDSVEGMLVNSYLDVDEEIVETERVADFVVDVNGGEIVTSMVYPTSMEASH